VRAANRRQALAAWAWARHHNVLSWYVRPLFLLPLAWSAHRRSATGIAVTLVGLATSMAWFPAPARVDPRVAEFLRFEQEWLTGEWTGRKVLLAMLAPAGAGLAVGDVVLVVAVRSLRRGHPAPSAG
jgi:hypothetical protein